MDVSDVIWRDFPKGMRHRIAFIILSRDGRMISQPIIIDHLPEHIIISRSVTVMAESPTGLCVRKTRARQLRMIYDRFNEYIKVLQCKLPFI